MKNALLLLLFLVLISTTMFGQSGIGGGMQGPVSNTYPIHDHPQRANRHDMAQETSLVGGDSITVASGERPLWEVSGNKIERPLGDVAREYRKLALYGSKKIQLYWEQQGGK